MKRIALISALFASLGSVAAAAYETSGDRWNPPQIVMYLNPSTPDMAADQAEASLRAAMAVWNNVATSQEQVSLIFGGRTDDAVTQFDRKNIVWFDQTGNCNT